MLSYRVFEKFARMLLEGYMTKPDAEESDLPVLFELVREATFRVDATNPRRTEMAGLQMHMFVIWRTRLRVIDGGAVPTEDDLRRISYTEWADAMYTFYWNMPRMSHLHMECVAVTLAYCYMRRGTRVITHIQELTATDERTGTIDRSTVYAIMRAAKTRELGRTLCDEILDASDLASERISAYLLRLDLTDEERARAAAIHSQQQMYET